MGLTKITALTLTDDPLFKLKLSIASHNSFNQFPLPVESALEASDDEVAELLEKVHL